MITFKAEARTQMIAIGEKGFPYEICGLILGKAGETRTVTEVFECGNLNKLKPETRYDMDPKDYLKGEALARQKGLDVVWNFPFPSRPSGQGLRNRPAGGLARFFLRHHVHPKGQVCFHEILGFERPVPIRRRTYSLRF